MIYQAEREHIVELCKDLATKGYFAGTGGNIMVRLSDDDVLVTPSARDYHSLTASNICVLKLDGLSQVDGDCTPSVESSMHAAVLSKRPDMKFSIHTHQPIASACTLFKSELKVPEEMSDILGSSIGMVGYAPSGQYFLTAKVKKTVQPNMNAYLLKNHGVVCVGKTCDNAVKALNLLEAIAREYVEDGLKKISASDTVQSAKAERLLNILSHSKHRVKAA